MTLLMRDKEQKKIGKYAEKVEGIRRKKDNVSKDVLIDFYAVNVSDLDKIIYFIDNKPEWDDEKIAEAVINGQSE